MKRNEPEGDVKKKKTFLPPQRSRKLRKSSKYMYHVCLWMNVFPFGKENCDQELKVYFIYLSKHLVYFTYNLQAEPSPTTGSFSKFQTVQGSGGAAAFLLTRGYASGNAYIERKASCFEYKYAGGSSSTSGSLATEHVVMLY